MFHPVADDQRPDGSWHDGRPRGCHEKDCDLLRGGYRDNRPAKGCGYDRPGWPYDCPHITAQQEWRKKRREKRRMAKLDIILNAKMRELAKRKKSTLDGIEMFDRSLWDSGPYHLPGE